MSYYIDKIHKLVFNSNYWIISNKHLPASECKRLYRYIFDYYNESGNRIPNKYISDLIIEAGEFDEWSDISPEFLPLEIIKQNINGINLRHLEYNKELTYEFYDELKLDIRSARLLNTSNKLTEKFLTSHKILFNPCNDLLSNEFILLNVKRINHQSKGFDRWKITNNFATELLLALADNKKCVTISKLFNNLDISYSVLEPYELLISHKSACRINRYEYIVKNMHIIYMFECIPFRVYKEHSLTILFDRIKPIYDIPVSF
jgi:hypothetical protein